MTSSHKIARTTADSRLRKGVADFVEKAFRTKMPVLIDFTMNNETLTKLIRHLRRHATGSIATANQYVYAT